MRSNILEVGMTTLEILIEQVKALPHEKQRRVLEFARSLSGPTPPGVPGMQLLRFAGAIPSGELRLMQAAIDQGCEQVDANDW
jgi:hypothetical protein